MNFVRSSASIQRLFQCLDLVDPGLLTEDPRRDLEGDERVLLREVVYASDDKCITLRTGHHTYKLDVRKVDPSELSAMCGVFRKMNFDSSIQLTGV